jgi:hypothetical protein
MKRERTRALLVAGKMIGEYETSWGALRAIRAACEHEASATELPIVAVAAGDTTLYEGDDHGDQTALYARIAVGLIAAEVDANDGPHGPLSRADLAATLERARALTPLFWHRIGACLPPPSLPFSPAQRRTSTQIYDGVALDRDEVGRIEPAIHLLPSGPLSYAMLAEGERAPLPKRDDEDDDGDEPDLTDWVYGYDCGQERHAIGVRGREIAVADMLGIASRMIVLDSLSADAALWLIARYD